MKFSYSRGGEGYRRPVLDLWLTGPASTLQVKMLVDSGSDWTMIPMGLFRALGIADEGEVHLGGLGGNVNGVLGTAQLRCAAGGWKGKVVGAPLPGDFPPVLGQQDFFRSFLVGFDGGQSAFYLEQPPTR